MLLAMSDLLKIDVVPLRLATPPPKLVAELPLMVESVTSRECAIASPWFTW